MEKLKLISTHYILHDYLLFLFLFKNLCWEQSGASLMISGKESFTGRHGKFDPMSEKIPVPQINLLSD